jgi:hypothetical protein
LSADTAAPGRVVLTRTTPVHPGRSEPSVSRIELNIGTIPPGIVLDSRGLIKAMKAALKGRGAVKDVELREGAKREGMQMSVIEVHVTSYASKGVVYTTIDDMLDNVWLEGNRLVFREPQPSVTPSRGSSKRQAKPRRYVLRTA